jgi:dephospho-CoA kinase
LGFNCPLCREYVPCPGAFDKPEAWAGLFPLNRILEALVHKPEGKLCDPCLRGNENEKATGLCISCVEYLCKTCTKHHLRQLFSKDHVVVCQLNEMKSGHIFPESGNIHSCPEHKNESIKFFCNDHQVSYCSVCIGTRHRKCESVDTIEDAAKCIKENGGLDVLLGDVKNLEAKLTKVQGEHDKNLAELENSVDEITAQTEKEFKELVDHLEILKNKHLDDVTRALKKGRGMLSDCSAVLSDGIQCADYCCKNIERIRETGDNAEIVMTYCSVKEWLMKLKQFNFTTKQITISEVKSQVLKDMRNMECFGTLEYAEFEHHLMYNVNNIELSLDLEFSITGENLNVLTGNLLVNGTFVTANYTPNGRCVIYNKNWESEKRIDGLDHPFEVIQHGEELLVTCNGTKSIEVFSAYDLRKLRNFRLYEPVYGITICNGACYLACATRIKKIDIKSDEILREYSVEGQNSINICATKNGHLIYTNWVLNTVTAMTDQGDNLWQYKNPKMVTPRGLDVDLGDNIFVAAEISNNIHVLSGAGALIRILEDIPKPIFIKLMEDRRMCCVCSNRNVIKLYKL